MSASEHFQAGRLREAIAAQNEAVRENPDNADQRVFQDRDALHLPSYGGQLG